MVNWQPGYGFIAVAANDAYCCSAHCAQAAAAGRSGDSMRGRPGCAGRSVGDTSGAGAGPRPAPRRPGSQLLPTIPAPRLTCIGVTGTNGKTSVAYHIADLSSLLGVPGGYCGTLGWGRARCACTTAGLTTPNAVALQRILASMREAGQQRAGTGDQFPCAGSAACA